MQNNLYREELVNVLNPKLTAFSSENNSKKKTKYDATINLEITLSFPGKLNQQKTKIYDSFEKDVD